MRPPRLYVYKLTTDNNGAPCVHRGLLSLAICKPMIRTTARAGDLIFGFAGNRLHQDNRLVYVAQVTEIIDGLEYYDTLRYQGRPDCIYEAFDGHYKTRTTARYHESGVELATDMGSPPDYERALVILSRDYRYLGGDSSGTETLSSFPAIERSVRRLGRGHRVNHSPQLAAELKTLKAEVWMNHDQAQPGTPSQRLSTHRCC